jgi:hypothetical protein
MPSPCRVVTVVLSRVMVLVALELPLANTEIPYPSSPEVVTVELDTVILEPTVGDGLRASPAAPLPEVVTVLPVIEMVPPALAKAPKPSTPVVVMITLEALIVPLPFACIPGPLVVVTVTAFNVRIGGGGTVTVLVI